MEHVVSILRLMPPTTELLNSIQPPPDILLTSHHPHGLTLFPFSRPCGSSTMLQSSLAPPHLHSSRCSIPSLPPLSALPLSSSSSSLSFCRRRCRRLSFGVHEATNFSVNPKPKVRFCSASDFVLLSLLILFSFLKFSMLVFICLLKRLKVSCSVSEPLKVMISGAPASGKGTQCEMIVQKVRT